VDRTLCRALPNGFQEHARFLAVTAPTWTFSLSACYVIKIIPAYPVSRRLALRPELAALLGGAITVENLQLLCGDCNREQGADL
jgi:hypothetical protein